MDLLSLRAHIPSMSKISAISQISKGFSLDKKYLLYEEINLPKYVLRTSSISIEVYQRKHLEFEVVNKIYEKGVKTSKPIEFGSIESLEICYMILSYVEGEDASEAITSLKYDEQYQIGIEAGQQLKIMHELTAPPSLESWHLQRLSKHKRQYEDYRNCGVKLPEEARILSFINENSHYMNNRPNRFQHDDFHLSNLIMNNKCYAGAIDYNRFDWGDPYHDFLKIAYFSREVSIPFCIGQIQGYFDRHIPMGFWNLYSLYTAMAIFPSITWTLQVVPDQLNSMLARISVVLEDHQNFESIVPLWFKP